MSGWVKSPYIPRFRKKSNGKGIKVEGLDPKNDTMAAGDLGGSPAAFNLFGGDD